MTIVPTKEHKDGAAISSNEVFSRYEKMLERAAQRELARQRDLDETVVDVRASMRECMSGEGRDAFKALDALEGDYGAPEAKPAEGPAN